MNALQTSYFEDIISEGSIVGVLLDMELGTLEFTVNGKKLGVAYQGPELKRGSWHFTLQVIGQGCTVRIVNCHAPSMQ